MGWADTVGGMTVVASVMRADQIFMNRANTHLRPLGLTMARYEVLGILNGYGAAPLGVIAEHMWITAATVTSNVNRLESAGLCRRRPHPTDARTTLAEITPKGRRVFERAVSAMRENVFGTVALSAQEARQLVELIAKIRVDAGDVVDAPPGDLPAGVGRAKDSRTRRRSSKRRD